METFPYFFTWMKQRGRKPLEIAGGDGAHFVTASGDRWLDLGSFSYNVNAGHGNRAIIDAIVAQAQSIPVSMANVDFPAKRELAEELLALAPEGFDRVFFTLSGAEANENAIKIARLVTGRFKSVSRYRSYHGATMGAISLTGDWRRPPVEPGLAGAVHALDCYCDRCPFGKEVATCARECATHIGDVLELEGNVAAVFLEPVPGANGVMVPPPEYWPMVREACDRTGALLVADEVLCGFGRTGRAFGIDHWGVVPDMMTVSKGITSGYASLGAVLVHERVSRRFDDRLLACGLTGYGHPLGCAAGVAALAYYREHDLFRRSAAMGVRLLARLRQIASDFPEQVRFARGLGLLACLELELDEAAWKRLDQAIEARRVYLHVYPDRGTVIFAPPLVVEDEDLGAGLDAFASALEEAIG